VTSVQTIIIFGEFGKMCTDVVYICAPGMGTETGGESPLGALMEGTPSRSGKGAFDKGVNTEVFLEGEGAARWRPVEA
jgi:hypothetical protein